MKFSKIKVLMIIIFVFILGSFNTATTQSLRNKKSIDIFENSVNIELDGKEIVKENTFYRKNEDVDIPYSINYNNTVFLPIRAISEFLNLNIEWSEEESKIMINYEDITFGYKDISNESSILKTRSVNDIINSYKENVEIMVIGSSDCEACNLYVPKINNLVKEYGVSQIIYVDTKHLNEEEKLLIKEEFDIKYIPTTIYIKDNEIKKKIIGDTSVEDIEMILNDIFQVNIN